MPFLSIVCIKLIFRKKKKKGEVCGGIAWSTTGGLWVPETIFDCLNVAVSTGVRNLGSSLENKCAPNWLWLPV